MEYSMTYIIAEPCVDVRDASCVDVCPVDCIYTTDNDNMFYINPDECIDCAACEPVCPVVAIFPEETVPEQWDKYTQMNYDYFKDRDLSELKTSL
jgi:NAD-dependent dihydropyrimidine dehydrogenase PreA subunit